MCDFSLFPLQTAFSPHSFVNRLNMAGNTRRPNLCRKSHRYEKQHSAAKRVYADRVTGCHTFCNQNSPPLRRFIPHSHYQHITYIKARAREAALKAKPETAGGLPQQHRQVSKMENGAQNEES